MKKSNSPANKIKSIVGLISVIICLSPLLCSPTYSQEINFDIKSDRIAAALTDFAKQAKVSVARPPLSFQDGKANALKGQFTLKQGLDNLLNGTGFSYIILSPAAVKIIPVDHHINILASQEQQIPNNNVLLEVDNIIVTATRRSSYAQNLPYSLSVTSGDDLNSSVGGTTSDVIYKIANVSATNQGNNRNKIIIRGLSDGPFFGRNQSLVMTYLDDTRMSYNAPDPSFNLVDISRVEVLRGPQGTLYGAGALGGIFRVVTHKPTFDLIESEISATYKTTRNGSDSGNYNGMLNIPVISDKVAVRLVGYHQNNGGYINDIRLNKMNINQNNLDGGRVSTSIKAFDWLTITGGYNLQHFKANDSNYYNAELNTFDRDNYIAEPRDDEFQHSYLTLEANLPWFDIVSNSAFIDRDIKNIYDGTLAVTKLSSLSQTPSTYLDERQIKTFSTETHISSKSGTRLEWLTGFFLSHRTEDFLGNLNTPNSSLVPGYGPTDILYSETLNETLNEIALFGEATYFLSEQLSITAGGRWFHFLDEATSKLDDVGFGNINIAKGEQKKSDFVPKFTLSFRANDQRLYYLQIAEGYRLGGINLKGPTSLIDNDGEVEDDTSGQLGALTSFNPDKLLNFELGFKQILFDGRLKFNGSFYYSDWKNIQSDQYKYTGLPIVGNVGSGNVKGTEVELLFQPDDTLSFQANAALNFSKLTSVSSDFGVSIGAVRGISLPGAPKFTLGIGSQYMTRLTQEINSTLSLNYNFIGSSHLLFSSLNAKRSDSYHLANISLAFDYRSWQLILFIDNMLNTGANTFAFGNPFSFMDYDQITPLRPRTAGLRVKWTY